MSPVAQAAAFVSLLLTIIGAVYKLTKAIEQAQQRIDRRFERIDSRLERLELRVAALEAQNRAFLQVFPKLVTGLIREKVLAVETGMGFVTEPLGTAPLSELFRDIKPTMNPLSQADLDQIRGYAERLKAGQPLSVPEARAFY